MNLVSWIDWKLTYENCLKKINILCQSAWFAENQTSAFHFDSPNKKDILQWHRFWKLNIVQKKLNWSYEKELPRLGIEPRTFRSSVWRSPNWAITAHIKLDMNVNILSMNQDLGVIKITSNAVYHGRSAFSFFTTYMTCQFENILLMLWL